MKKLMILLCLFGMFSVDAFLNTDLEIDDLMKEWSPIPVADCIKIRAAIQSNDHITLQESLTPLQPNRNLGKFLKGLSDGQEAIAELLVQAGASVDYYTENDFFDDMVQHRPLEVAILRHDFGIARKLVRLGARIDLVNGTQHFLTTPVHSAVRQLLSSKPNNKADEIFDCLKVMQDCNPNICIMTDLKEQRTGNTKMFSPIDILYYEKKCLEKRTWGLENANKELQRVTSYINTCINLGLVSWKDVCTVPMELD